MALILSIFTLAILVSAAGFAVAENDSDDCVNDRKLLLRPLRDGDRKAQHINAALNSYHMQPNWQDYRSLFSLLVNIFANLTPY